MGSIRNRNIGEVMEKKLIKRIPIKILVSDFIITFSYETKKGYVAFLLGA